MLLGTSYTAINTQRALHINRVAVAAAGGKHKRRVTSCSAHRGSGSNPDWYQVLGLPSDASDDEVKAAYRRKAKETHPDVAKEMGAEAFIAVTQAYEVLGDPQKRAEYDRTYGRRRINFFRDMDDYGDPVTPSYGDDFRPSWRTAARPGDDDFGNEERRRYRGYDRWQQWRPSGDGHDDAAESREAAEGGGRGGFGWSDLGGRNRRSKGDDVQDDGGEQGSGNDAPDSDQMDAAEREAKRLERLMELMSGAGPYGPLKQWQGRQMDPWGASGSDTWARRVQQQVNDPWSGRGRGAGRPGPDWGRQTEWQAPGRRVPGGDDDYNWLWSAPGREEWMPPGRSQRPDDGEDERGSRGRRSGGLSGGDGGFRGKPL